MARSHDAPFVRRVRQPSDEERTLLPDGGEEGEEGDEEATEESSSESESPAEEGEDAPDEEEEEEAGEEEEEEEEEEEDYRDEEGTTVLYLDLEGLFLDLLGLEVDLEEVELDVSAIQGEGRLLGNLLSGVADLLSTGGSGLLDDFLGGSLFEGLMGDGLFGGSDDENSESMSDRVSSKAQDAFSNVPIDELLTSLLKELVDQLVGEKSESGGESEESNESTS